MNHNKYNAVSLTPHSGADPKFNRDPKLNARWKKKAHEKAKRIAATAAITVALGTAGISGLVSVANTIGGHFQKEHATTASLEHVGGTVTIESGETVYGVAQGIANKEHKDPRDVEADIAAVNPGVNTGAVEAGQAINIPAPEFKDVSKAYQPTYPVAHPNAQTKR